MDSTIARTLSDASSNGYISVKQLSLLRGAKDVDAVRQAWYDSCAQHGQMYIEILTLARDRVQLFWSASGLTDGPSMASDARRQNEALCDQLRNDGRECATTYSGRQGEDDPNVTAGTIEGLTLSEAQAFARNLNDLASQARNRS